MLREKFFEVASKNKGITVIESDDRENYISYHDLYQKAFKLAGYMQKHFAIDKEVVIRCKKIENYIICFWACVIGGYIAVPIDVRQNDYNKQKIMNMLSNFDSYYLLCDYDYNSEGINIEKVDWDSDYETVLVKSDTDRIVYVQMSSGSTNKSKLIALTEENITTNVKDIYRRYHIEFDDISLSWQPLTHCYGFIVFHVMPLLCNMEQILIPVDLFMKKPLIWLDKTNKYRANRLGSIPFALEHFLRIYRSGNQVHNWDLSCVKSLMVGGEHVCPKIIESFCSEIEKHGLKVENVVSAYGLAESTTIVSILTVDMPKRAVLIDSCEMEIGEPVNICEPGKKNANSFLSMGKPLDNVEAMICDENYNKVEDMHYGRLCIRGKSIIKDYYCFNESAEFFHDGWLDTGDIGFIDKGELFITGRTKELVIVRGKKYSCLALENIVREIIISKIDCNIVVSRNEADNNDDGIVVFIECDKQELIREIPDLEQQIKNQIFNKTGLFVDSVIIINDFPRTFSGKLKRLELVKKYMEGTYESKMSNYNDNNSNRGVFKSKNVIDTIVNKINSMFGIKIDDYNRMFKDYGIISINIPPFVKEIQNVYKIELNVSDVFSYPTVNQFADMICDKLNKISNKANDENHCCDDNRVAIVGMSCRLPGGADNIDQFWDVLINGVDGVVDIPKERWDLKKFYSEDEDEEGKMYCKKSGFLQTPVDQFDMKLFNISPKEAAAIDPQQRLLLELTWEAFENANYNISNYCGSNTGVYVGISSNEYTLSSLFSSDLSAIDAYSLTGTAFSVACGRISYTFGFEGPCFSVDTACSSGLTAFHLASEALKNNESNMAVVAGVNLILSPFNSIGFSKLRATSKDGYCKSFDASANGYGRGEGGGVLLLKRYKDAVKAGDHILGVVCATGINQDGRSNGLTAPNGKSQAKLINKTITKAGLTTADIDYMEMHGTGTKLGDPIEVNAVSETYGKGHDENNPFYIGSVKSNIGHLEPASGMASIIKVLLSMQNEVIPANLHFKEPNPLIRWNSMPVKVVDKNLPWAKREKTRRAAVSGFGFGGSNAHVILEEYKNNKHVLLEQDGIEYVLKISAKTKNSLNKYIENYIDYFENICSDEDFPSAILCANRGRTDMDFRIAVVAHSRTEVLNALKQYRNGDCPENVFSNEELEDNERKRKLVFMFTGQGAQYVNMGKLLYNSSSVFKTAFDECDRLFKPFILRSLVELIYGENADNSVIERTEYAQPLLFSIEYALCRFWEKLGVKPDITIGHSIGEYAAAVESGVMTLSDAVKLVAIRGRLMNNAPGKGGMATVYSSFENVKALIEESKSNLSIAANNASELCTISGNLEDIDKMEAFAISKGVKIKKLKVSHGFHSYLMEPILSDFYNIAKEVNYSEPDVEFVSALNLKTFNSDCVPDADYWTEHIKGTVRFYDVLKKVAEDDNCTFLEIGPNRVLTAMLKLVYPDNLMQEGSLNIKVDDSKQLANAIAMLYSSGVNIDWNNVSLRGITVPNYVNVPSYPYDKIPCWKPLDIEKKHVTVQDENYDVFLGQRFETPGMKDTVIFQRVFTSNDPFFMSEHIIFETAISPAAAHLSMVMSAVKKVKNPERCVLKSVELITPLAIAENEERIVQVCLSTDENGKMSFEIVSKDNKEESDWITHTRGIVEIADNTDNNESVSIDEFKKLDVDALAPSDGVYKLMHDSGFELGEGFRRIVTSSCSEGGSVCHIVPKTDIINYNSYDIYPGIIDSVLQTQLCTLFEDLNRRNEGKSLEDKKTIIPYYLGNVVFTYRDFKELWVKGSSHVGDGVVYSKLNAYNERGEVVISMSDTMANMTNKVALLRDFKRSYKNWYFHKEWVSSDRISNNTDLDDVNYIILSDNEDTLNKISAGLIKKGIKSENIQSVIYANITDVDKIKNILESGIDNVSIIYSCSNPHINEEDNLNATRAFFELIKAITDQKAITPSIKCVIEDGISNIYMATIIGQMRTLSIEYPKIYSGVLYIDSFENNAVYNGIILPSKEEIKISGSKYYVSRLVKNNVYLRNNPNNNKSLEISSEGTYLITGGTGALGIAYANELVDMGASKIILLSRSGNINKISDELEALTERGVNMKVLSGDNSNYESFANALKDEKMNIRGIIHAAGVLNDKMISDMSWEEYEKVLMPKVNGLINIKKFFVDSNLEFVLCLSSITSVMGNIGQSSYAAANNFMNAFAEYYSDNDTAYYTMCWGPWSESGMANSNAMISSNIQEMGIKMISQDDGRKIIHEFFENPINELVIADVDWNKFKENSYSEWQTNFINQLVVTENKESKNNIIDILDSKSMTERYEYLLDQLKAIFGKVLGHENSHVVSTSIGLREQGADSLMIFSMRTAVNKLLKTNIDVTTFYNYPSLDVLTKYILGQVLYKDEEEGLDVSLEDLNNLLND